VFSSSKKNILNENKPSRILDDNMEFVFQDSEIGSVNFAGDNLKLLGYTFDTRSLAIHMFQSSEDALQEIRSNMKIVYHDKLIPIDDETFNALMDYGNRLCSLPRLVK